MPQLTLTYGGRFCELVTAPDFFSPLFLSLSQEATIDPALLKGWIQQVDQFAIGRFDPSLVEVPDSFAHLELALLEGRRSDEAMDSLADRLETHLLQYFSASLAHDSLSCYITNDIRLIPRRFHRSVRRGRDDPRPLTFQPHIAIHEKRADLAFANLYHSVVSPDLRPRPRLPVKIARRPTNLAKGWARYQRSACASHHVSSALKC